LRSRKYFTYFCWKIRAQTGHELARNRKDGPSPTQDLPLSADFCFHLNPCPAAFDAENARLCHNTQLRSRSFGNSIHTVRKIPLASHEQVPDDLHQNYARRFLHRSAHGPVQPWPEDAFKHLSPANALKITLAILSIDRAAEEAVPVRKCAKVPQQVKPKTKPSRTRTPGKSAGKEQVVKSPAAITAAARGILNAYTETAWAPKRCETKPLHERTHTSKSISEERYSPVNHESIDAVCGHAATDSGLCFQHQRL
jgi:hypothetical protein